MADDDSLRQMADRIQARAVRRMGELLKQYDGKGNNQHSGDAPTKLTQKQAAAAAGISKDQTVTAVRVANVPAAQFEAAIESDKPATVTALAEMGKQVRSVPEGFRATVTGIVLDMAKLPDKVDWLLPLGVWK